jgi:hypothetical protein
LATFAATVVAAVTLGGCGCVSMGEAEALSEELWRRNLASRVQAVERAAAELGAVLLHGEMMSLPSACMGNEQWSVYRRFDCMSFEQVEGRVWRLWTSRGETKLALVLDRFHLNRGERLARNETKLFILTPKSVPRKVDEGVQCECDAMPRAIPDETIAIIADDAPIRSVAEATVHYSHDFIEWECKGYGM